MNEQQQPGQEQPDRTDLERKHRGEVAPQIWAASLADYNSGILHGQWLEAAQSVEELEADIAAMLARSKQPNAEEWGIFDYQGFGQLRLGEYESLAVVSRVAMGIVEHGPAFAAWAELHDADPGMLEAFQDAYIGEYESREAFAQTIVDDFGIEDILSRELPAWLAAHVSVDLAGIAHDLQISGDIWIEDDSGGGVWVFRVQ